AFLRRLGIGDVLKGAKKLALAVDQVNAFVEGAHQAFNLLALLFAIADHLVHRDLPKRIPHANWCSRPWLLRTRLWFNCAICGSRGKTLAGTGYLPGHRPHDG